MTVEYRIVDKDGGTVMSADSISELAAMYRMTPLAFARREARNLGNDTDGEFRAEKEQGS